MTKYKKQIHIAIMVGLLALLAVYFSNRGCSPSAPYLCWTPADRGGVEGDRVSDTYHYSRSRQWHKYCDAECRKPAECYYYCCGGDSRFDQSEAPDEGAANGCPCFFGERFPFTGGMAGVCNPAMAGNLRNLLAKGGAGDLKAQLTLGMLYEQGRNGDPAPSGREAFSWYGRAAEQGDAYAQYKLGAFYEAGIGVAAHCTRAMEWYEKAAGKRDNSADTHPDSYAAAAAQARLGDIYKKGSCGPFDYVKAAYWYKLAEGSQSTVTPMPDDPAALHLGDLYMKGGYGLEKNPAEAIKWYRAAASSSAPSESARAQFELAMIYAKGDVVEQDFQTACRWYAAAGRDPRYQSRNICDPIEPYLMPGELEKVIPLIGSGQLPE